MRVIVILGNKLKTDGTMTKLLKKRLEKGIELFNSLHSLHNNNIIIVSGGNVAGVKHTEAYCMKKYLISRNIPEDKIIIENKSKETFENLVFVNRIITKLKSSNKLVMIVTNKQHALKVEKIISNNNFYFKYKIKSL
jgi:uncharacterized SAM-binding protein YcdF (DUF218 family)